MADKTKVLVKVLCDDEIKETLNSKFGEECEFCFAQDDEKTFDENVRFAEVFIGEPNPEQLTKAKSLKWLQLTWAGADKHLNMEGMMPDFCVTNASGAFGVIISEYAIGGIVAIYRSFPQYLENKKKRSWDRIDSADIIYGKKALVIGTGDLGKNVAYRLKAFGAHVVGVRKTNNTSPIEGFDEVRHVSDLDALLPEVDIVVGCLPNTPESTGMLDYDRMRKMKQDAVLVNVGRGNLIITDDLVKVLEEGRLKGVVLDVFEVEPLPDDSPLWVMDKVLMTPHISGPSFGGNWNVQENIWKIVIDNLGRYVRGEDLINVVDHKIGY